MKIVYVVGGLGSQMMAYSLMLALRRHYSDVQCDFSWYDYNPCHDGAELHNIFGLVEDKVNFWTLPLGLIERKFNVSALPLHVKSWASKSVFKALKLIGLATFYHATRNRYNYDENVFAQRGFVIFYQCWTAWQYFEGIEGEIRQSFKFPEFQDPSLIKLASQIECANSVSVHVRRGDYLKSSTLGNLIPIAYFHEAMAFIKAKTGNPTFFVFSNDIDWCKNNIFGNDVHFVDRQADQGSDNFRDMQLMSLCKHNIISNSSFSWWGAYLNSNRAKMVITPERWANPESDADLNDMNMPGWVKIRNY